MSKALALSLLVPFAAGCRNAEVAEVQRGLIFEEVVAPDTSRFTEHGSHGAESAWYNEQRDQVLVLDKGSGRGLKISGFPARLGRICATGWDAQSGGRFFLHLSRGADFGTMLFLALDTRRVLEIGHWHAW